ncbi:MAG: DUF29 family protein [Methylococcaceae bacterium]
MAIPTRTPKWGLSTNHKRTAQIYCPSLKKTPSLNSLTNDSERIKDAWRDAVSIAINETGMGNFPESCPWAIENIHWMLGFPH